MEIGGSTRVLGALSLGSLRWIDTRTFTYRMADLFKWGQVDQEDDRWWTNQTQFVLFCKVPRERLPTHQQRSRHGRLSPVHSHRNRVRHYRGPSGTYTQQYPSATHPTPTPDILIYCCIDCTQKIQYISSIDSSRSSEWNLHTLGTRGTSESNLLLQKETPKNPDLDRNRGGMNLSISSLPISLISTKPYTPRRKGNLSTFHQQVWFPLPYRRAKTTLKTNRSKMNLDIMHPDRDNPHVTRAWHPRLEVGHHIKLSC